MHFMLSLSYTLSVSFVMFQILFCVPGITYQQMVTISILSTINNIGYVTRIEGTVKCTFSVAISEKSGSKVKGILETIGSMGNCMEPPNPEDSILRGISVDTTPIKESGLPIIFVIGGPGVGKRAIGIKVAQKYGFLSIITADIVRHEVSTRTERAFAMARLISEGRLVPSDILVELITVKMLDNLSEKKGFIVSGFPREKLQAVLFDQEVRPPDLVIFLDVRNSVLSDRIMARNVMTASRLTLNFDFIRRQIKDFHKRNKPVVKYYKQLLVVIDGEYDVNTIVFDNVCRVIDNLLVNHPGYQAHSILDDNATSTNP